MANGFAGAHPKRQWDYFKLKISEKMMALLTELQEAQKEKNATLIKRLDPLFEALDDLEGDSGIELIDAVPEIRQLFKIIRRDTPKN